MNPKLVLAALAHLSLLACRSDREPPAATTMHDVTAETATSPTTTPPELKQRIEGHMAGVLPGVGACLLAGAEIVWCDGFGVSDLRTGASVSPDTPFLLASVTKVVTATALMQLVEAGRLDLDAPVPFPVSHPESDRPITARALLTHTAGIADSDAMDDFYAWGADTALTLAAAVRGYLLDGGRWYDPDENFIGAGPGTVYEYSNMGFAAAGYLVELVSADGADLRAHTHAHIFAPLGMSHSYWRLGDVPADVDVAIPHGPGSDGPEPAGLYTFADYPDGGLFASARDVARFLAAMLHDGGSVLRPASLAAMLSVQLPDLDREQGIGWYRFRVRGETWWAHEGGELGVATVILLDPAGRRALVLLANGESDTGGPLDAIRDELLELLATLGPER